ncbi:MAG: cytochrome P450, partial [Acidimicrobiaceae bacterium]|nr:cytochrome P450 [Acidimicrobiaceae bacterium]
MGLFQRQEYHEVMERLRETDPGIHWVDEGDRGSGYWAVTRHVHVKEVNRRADVFSS